MGESASPTVQEPAQLNISFTHPHAPHKRAQLTAIVDLVRHPDLLLALGPSVPNRAVQRADAYPAGVRRALSNAVANLLLEPLLERLHAFGFADARLDHIERIAQGQSGDAPVVLMSLAQHEGDATRQYRVGLSMTGDALAWVEAIATSEPRQFASFAGLNIPGRLLIGSRPIALRELQTLKAGDVLLRALFPSFDTRFAVRHDGPADGAPATARAFAVWGAPGYRSCVATVTVTLGSLTILKEPYMAEEVPFAAADTLAGAPGEPIAIEEFELPVQFEIDTVALSIGQLSVLRAGYVIELPIKFADARLRLVAHGQTIGHGELVTVGEHLGVRIVRMAHSQVQAPKDSDVPV
jgi:type III secretion protein Q